jgi:hypothetical protein
MTDPRRVARCGRTGVSCFGKSSSETTKVYAELQGYGVVAGGAPLDAVLGVKEGDHLVVHVSAYRLHAGQIVEPSALTGPSVPALLRGVVA